VVEETTLRAINPEGKVLEKKWEGRFSSERKNKKEREQ